MEGVLILIYGEIGWGKKMHTRSIQVNHIHCTKIGDEERPWSKLELKVISGTGI